MSYRHDQTRKGRRPRTGPEHKRLIIRDTRFCQRWGIPEERAWLYSRRYDETITLDQP